MRPTSINNSKTKNVGEGHTVLYISAKFLSLKICQNAFKN
jgi:hypothetical protein